MHGKQHVLPGSKLSRLGQTRAVTQTKAKATQAAGWAKGSLARIYQGVANGLRVFGKRSVYED